MACFPMPAPRLSGGAVRLGAEAVGWDPASGGEGTTQESGEGPSAPRGGGGDEGRADTAPQWFLSEGQLSQPPRGTR